MTLIEIDKLETLVKSVEMEIKNVCDAQKWTESTKKMRVRLSMNILGRGIEKALCPPLETILSSVDQTKIIYIDVSEIEKAFANVLGYLRITVEQVDSKHEMTEFIEKQMHTLKEI